MTNYKLLLLLLLSTLCTPALAYIAKDGNVTASLGPFIYKTNFNDTDAGAKSPLLSDFGILVGGDISGKSSLEIGLFHLNKLFFREKDAFSIVEESQVMHISMGYRRWLSPYVSILGGFYSAYPMDEPRIVQNNFIPGTEVDTSARDLTEYGFDLSVQSELWHDSFISIIADARYSLSITSMPDEKADHYGVMLAIRYLVQERVSRIKKLPPAK